MVKLNQKKKFKQYPTGYFHIDIAEVRTEEGKLYLLDFKLLLCSVCCMFSSG